MVLTKIMAQLVVQSGTVVISHNTANFCFVIYQHWLFHGRKTLATHLYENHYLFTTEYDAYFKNFVEKNNHKTDSRSRHTLYL